MSVNNYIKVRADGPLLCTGQIEIIAADGSLLKKSTDVVLCRCGYSREKPFCDGSHKVHGFKHDGCFTDEKTESLVEPGVLKISVRENAMLIAAGPVTIISADSSCQATRNKAALCRCGQSASKPFCDISHRRCDFQDG